MKLVKVINYEKKWKGKDGRERPSVNFYFCYENDAGEEKYICVKPHFKNDIYRMNALASVVVKGK